MLICLLLLTRLAGAGELESRWQSLEGAGEWTRYADTTPTLFRDAEGWTRSLFATGGAGARWLAAAGVSDQRIEQETWSFRGLKRSLWLARALSPGWGVEAYGQSSSTSMSWPVLGGLRTSSDHGWSLGGGLNWCPRPEAAAPLTWNGRLLTMRSAYPSTPEKGMAGELNLGRRQGSGGQRLGLLVSRTGEDWKVAGLARGDWARGRLEVGASALAGHQDNWLDVERLVLHDGTKELKAAASLGIGWRIWSGLSLRSSAGWEKVAGSESRWVYLGVRWTRRTWAVVP